MRAVAIAACTLALCSSSCAVLPEHTSDPAPIVRGPLAWRVQHPFALTSLAMTPRSLPTQKPGTHELHVSASYASIFENAAAPSERVVLDGEILRVAARLRTPLTEDADFDFELPFVYASSGFLDAFVREFHELLNLPAGGSDERPAFDYDMVVERNGDTVYHLEPNQVEIGDIPLIVTKMLVHEDEENPSLAWRAGIELPTGDEDRGYGNGAVDFGAGLCAQRSLGRWTLSGGLDYISTGESDRLSDTGASVDDEIDAQFATEYRWNDRLSLLGGLIYEPPVLDEVELVEIDSPILQLNLGFAWDAADASTISVAFGEDLIADSGPDFAVFLAWALRF